MQYPSFFKAIVFFLCVIGLWSSCQESLEPQVYALRGDAFGTTFSIQYIGKKPLVFSKDLDSVITVINASMSTYQNDSSISKSNAGDTTVVVDTHFRTVFTAAQSIYKETQGVFDPTIGILVNAWDFGPNGTIHHLDSLRIDSLLQTVGLDKVQLTSDSRIRKQHPNTFLDFNALAKGYAVDVFASLVESEGVENYLVEIGGEIRGKGKNTITQTPWRIGVEDPNFDGTQSYSKVVYLQDEAMATSGSYRKYKVDSLGRRYAHIIDPKTGYPLRSSLLSVSVLAKTCMEADAYATALMAMGREQAITFLTAHPELKAYLIYENEAKALETKTINGFGADLTGLKDL